MISANNHILRLIASRIMLIIPGLAGVALIVYAIISFVPGDPVYALVGERADRAVIEEYRAKLGLDRGFFERYFRYLFMAARGDLGTSCYTGNEVGKELLQKFPNTLLLAVTAIFFAVVSGLTLGILSAFLKGTLFDRIVFAACTMLVSLPVFWFGMLLVYLFAVQLKWLPAAGMDSPLSFILPSLTLGARSAAYLARLTRSCFIEILDSPYILAVRARGGGILLMARHAWANAVIPLITYIALDFGSYLNGSVLTETIFGWDGIGRYAITGILRRDYPVITGTVLFGAVIFMLVNLVIDILYVFLNPKIRQAGSNEI